MSNDVFAVVADPTRRRILGVVKNGPHPVNDVVTELGVSQPTVSKHLKVLREAGLVTMKAQGQKRLYSLNPQPLLSVQEWMEELVAHDAAPEALAESAPVEAAPAEAAPSDTAPAEAAPAEPEPTGVVEGEHARPESALAEDARSEETQLGEAQSDEAQSEAHQPAHAAKRRDEVVFTPLAPLSPADRPAGGDSVEPFDSDLAPAVVGPEQEAAAPPERPVLDPQAQRGDDEHKPSGFLANLFGRRRAR